MTATPGKSPRRLPAGAALLAIARAIPRATASQVVPPTLRLDQARALLQTLERKLKFRLLRIETSAQGRIVAVVSAVPAGGRGKTRAANRPPTSLPRRSARRRPRVEERIPLWALAELASRQRPQPCDEIEPMSFGDGPQAGKSTGALQVALALLGRPS